MYLASTTYMELNRFDDTDNHLYTRLPLFLHAEHDVQETLINKIGKQ